MTDSRMLAGRFALGREVGSGGMARVYVGRDEVLGRPVAVKVLRPGLSGTETAQRFRREGSLAARLSHPNIIPVYDAGEAELDGQSVSYIVMEYVSGGDLKDRIRAEDTLDAREICRIGSGAASALAHAHERGIVHRDVKPHNILLDEYGEPKLTDFGISRALEGTQYTQTGNFLGTALYSAPEQLRGAEISGKVDVYSLGVVLYESVTGSPPFSGTVVEVAERHFSERPKRPETEDELADVILSCLAKNLSDRPSADALADRLHALSERGPSQLATSPATPPLRSESSPDRTATMQRTFPRRRRSRVPLVIACVAAALILAAGVSALMVTIGAVGYLTDSGPTQSGQGQSQNSSESASDNASSASGDPSGSDSSSGSGSGSSSGSGGTSSTNGSPEDAAVGAVRELYETAAAEDYDRSYMLLSESFRTSIAPTREQWTGQFGTLESIRFVGTPEVEVSGNTATVSVTTIAVHSNRTERNEATWELIREDGEWKLDGLATQPAA